MKELYLAMAVLCFLVAVMVYCLNKGIQILKETRDLDKKYKQSKIDFEKVIKDFYKEK